MLDAFSPADALERSWFFVPMARWDQHRDGPANGFLWSVAEQALRAAIPALNDSVQILADDCVLGIFDNGGQPRSRRFGLFTRRDVDKDVDPANHHARLIL